MSNQDFIERLARKRRNWIEATRENGFEEGVTTVLSELYPDNAHCLYELLQNAEDSGANKVAFHLHQDALQCIHNGRDFDQADVEGITGIGSSPKKGDVNKIGKFGVGFKAVFAYTNSPHIECDSFNFRIDHLVCPRVVSECVDERPTGHTRFTFQFDKKQKPPNLAFEEMATALEHFSSATLLFLHNIRVIHWHIDGRGSGELLLRERDLVCRITRTVKDCSTVVVSEKCSDWLCLKEPSETAPKLNVGIAFKLEPRDAAKTANLFDMEEGPVGDFWKVVPHERGRLCVYFPAEKEATNLRFHINAPFASTIGRDCIPHDDANGALRDQIIRLLVRSLVRLRDEKLLGESFLGTLPNTQDSLEQFYIPFRDKLKDVFSAEPLLETLDGGFLSSKDLYLGSEAFRNVFGEEELRFVSGNERARWAKPVFNSRARSFLHLVLEIPEWDEDRLGRAVRRLWDVVNASDKQASQWLAARDPQWLRSFYRLLTDRDISVVFCCIVLGEDLELHRPAEIYMSPDNMNSKDFESLSLVHRSLLDDAGSKGKKMSEVLSRLGVKEVSMEEVVRVVLNQHYTGREDQVAAHEHVEHMKRFVDYWNSHGRNISVFRNRRMFLGDAEDGFHRAADVFLGLPYCNTGLQQVVHSSCRSRMLWSGYAAAGIDIAPFAEALGVHKQLEIEHIEDVTLNPGLGTNVTKNTNAYQSDYRLPRTLLPNDTVYKQLQDVGTQAFDPNLPAESEWNVEKAKYVWALMRRQPGDVLKAQYRKSNPVPYDSLLLQFLREYAWLPDKSGVFRQPREVSADRLPNEFPLSHKNGWLAAVEFGEKLDSTPTSLVDVRDRAEELIKQRTGFSLSQMEELKKAGLTEDDFAKLIEEKRKTIPQPSNTSANLIRRTGKAKEAAGAAPSKKDSMVTQSVRREGSSTRVERRAYLAAKYENEDGELVCQLCRDRLSARSFKKRNDEVYFWGGALLPSLQRVSVANGLLLCPLCGAKYEVLVRSDEDQVRSLEQRIATTDPTTVEECDLVIDVDLNGSRGKLHFVQTHWIDLRAALEAERGELGK